MMLTIVLSVWLCGIQAHESAINSPRLGFQEKRTHIEALIIVAARLRDLSWDKSQVRAMSAIAWRESDFNPHMQNPRSTSYGLYGFIDSTWKDTGIHKTSRPFPQTLAAVIYIKNRYKTPQRAYKWHLNHGNY